VSVAIAIRFLDEAATRPVVHQCGEYQGPTANDVMVTVSCLEEGYGYAIYAQFHGDVATSPQSRCSSLPNEHRRQ
jgi:hypothetical protein